MSVVDKITKTIDEVLFRRLLLDELRQLNSNIARITYSLEMVFPAPPEQSYTRNPEDAQIDYANEGPEPTDESEPQRKREGIVDAGGSDSF
jgi:hypothetical protein